MQSVAPVRTHVGAGVGAGVGDAVGDAVGAGVGDAVGPGVGDAVGGGGGTHTSLLHSSPGQHSSPSGQSPFSVTQH